MGLRVARVEIKAIDPPPSIRDSMEKQMRADRDKRAIILTAEGARQSAITTAEGQKAAAILSAEGKKQAAILEAEAERQSRILRAEGERAALFLQAQGQAKSIETVFQAIHDGKPDQGCWPTSTCRRCRRSRRATPTRCGSCPASSARRWRGCPARRCRRRGQVWLDVEPSANGSAKPTAEMDTTGWFESQLPAAADQREAKIEPRASPTLLPQPPDAAGDPSLTQAKEEVREIGSAELPPATAAATAVTAPVHWSAGPGVN